MLDLRAQYGAIQGEIQAALTQVLESQQFILGAQGRALEEEIAAYCGVRFAVGVASGTDALALALRAAGVCPGDHVIVPAFTFIATAGAVMLVGARPVFADIEPTTFTLDPAQVASRATPRTKAVIPVHLYGHPADMDPLLAVAHERGLAVIEDNAQAIGAAYKGRRTGSFGTAAGLSFYPSKNLGGFGDGGMVLTNAEEIAERIRRLRDHGQTRKYISAEPGWNSRLDELQAAVLRVKLRHLDAWTRLRQAHAARYMEMLRDVPGMRTPTVASWASHVFYQYTVRIEGPGRRDAVQQYLARQAISSAVYYPVPLPLQPALASLGHRAGDFPAAERAASEVLSLPLYPELAAEQIERVARAARQALSG